MRCWPRPARSCRRGRWMIPRRDRADFQAPSRVRRWQRGCVALLIYLGETAVGAGTRWQAVLLAEDRQISLGVGVIVGVDNRHRVSLSRCGREVIGCLDVGWAKSGGLAGR